ncbi:MAG: hypothetical protein H0Z33_07750 [Bacillaceae bacterium]|nr:hypothetical protein [Bacillaceae bacterium]
MRKKRMALMLALILGMTVLSPSFVRAAGPLSLYTPYTNIAVTPGESIHYSIDVINNSTDVQSPELSVEGLPEGWEYQLTSGGWSIKEISVLPDESRSVSLDVEVPLKVDRGTYSFRVTAGSAVLPLTVRVTEQGTYKTELTTEQPNMEGHADSSFNYEATIKNRTADEQLYALRAEAPRGWDVRFEADGKTVTSVKVEANADKDIDVEITPPEQVKKGTYQIPITASTSSTSAETTLEVVITGTYDLELTTPNGLLSTDITAGGEKNLTLEVRNTGSADLRDIQLRADTPVNWEVTFEPKTINKLAAGNSTEVTATIKADGEAIAGDYVVNMSATTPEASSDAQFRVTVETSLLWGWFGILIILAVIGGVYYLFRTYGRR